MAGPAEVDRNRGPVDRGSPPPLPCRSGMWATRRRWVRWRDRPPSCRAWSCSWAGR